jgi:hypothetical protein
LLLDDFDKSRNVSAYLTSTVQYGSYPFSSSPVVTKVETVRTGAATLCDAARDASPFKDENGKTKSKIHADIFLNIHCNFCPPRKSLSKSL